jgi:HAD superfamily hydrolase (TIGR01450 family)
MGVGQGTGRDHLMTDAPVRDAEWAFAAYEAARHRMPSPDFPAQARGVDNLAELVGAFDLFLLDAFGVLNRGDQVVPGAPERVAQLKAMGKKVLVVSNASGFPKPMLMVKYQRLGYDFSPMDVLCSREILFDRLMAMPRVLNGVIASDAYPHAELDALECVYLRDDRADYDRAERIVFLGVAGWNDDQQALLEASLAKNPRPVIVGNPDIVAPRSSGFSREPGYFAHHLADRTGISPEFCGKPYGLMFEQALERVGQGIDRSRILMVGDTLQTDILGGRAAGLKTALITGHGALRGMDAGSAIARSGIVPDFVMESP